MRLGLSCQEKKSGMSQPGFRSVTAHCSDCDATGHVAATKSTKKELSILE
jgi:hypothetical protein